MNCTVCCMYATIYSIFIVITLCLYIYCIYFKEWRKTMIRAEKMVRLRLEKLLTQLPESGRRHFNDFKIVNIWFHWHTSNWHLGWENSVRWWQAKPGGGERASSNEVTDSIHDNTLSPGLLFWSQCTDVQAWKPSCSRATRSNVNTSKVNTAMN